MLDHVRYHVYWILQSAQHLHFIASTYSVPFELLRHVTLTMNFLISGISDLDYFTLKGEIFVTCWDIALELYRPFLTCTFHLPPFYCRCCFKFVRFMDLMRCTSLITCQFIWSLYVVLRSFVFPSSPQDAFRSVFRAGFVIKKVFFVLLR